MDHASATSIGVKRMGELDLKLFQNVFRGKFSRQEADLKAAQLCSLWQARLRDGNWHPFKVVEVEGSEEMQVRI